MFWYRVLLACYPRAFRAEYGDELLGVFRQRHLGATTVPGRLTTWLSIAGDTLVAAAGAHADLARQDLRTSMRTFRRSPGFAAPSCSWPRSASAPRPPRSSSRTTSSCARSSSRDPIGS